jgi:hypothetical protein
VVPPCEARQLHKAEHSIDAQYQLSRHDGPTTVHHGCHKSIARRQLLSRKQSSPHYLSSTRNMCSTHFLRLLMESLPLELVIQIYTVLISGLVSSIITRLVTSSTTESASSETTGKSSTGFQHIRLQDMS